MHLLTALGYFTHFSAIAFVLANRWALVVTVLPFTFLLSSGGLAS